MGTNDKMYSRVDLITYKYFCLLYVRGSVKWGSVFHQYNRDGRECVAEDVPFMTNVQHICIMYKGYSLALLRSCGVAGELPVVVWYYMFCPEEEISSGDMFVVPISLS